MDREHEWRPWIENNITSKAHFSDFGSFNLPRTSILEEYIVRNLSCANIPLNEH